MATIDQETRATWPHLTILARTPGSGVPTWPGTRSPRSGCDSAMPISVMPYLAQYTCHVSLYRIHVYLSSSTWPVTCCHLVRVGTASAADPLTISLWC